MIGIARTHNNATSDSNDATWRHLVMMFASHIVKPHQYLEVTFGDHTRCLATISKVDLGRQELQLTYHYRVGYSTTPVTDSTPKTQWFSPPEISKIVAVPH